MSKLHTKRTFLYTLKASLVITEKNARIYYLKAPVIIFGILFPVFFFLAFALGKKVVPFILVPGLVAMTLFFTSSSVGPLITPWERNAKTYERLLASPVSLSSILLGDMLAGVIFGVIISSIPLTIGILFFNAKFFHPLFLAGNIVLSSLCFSSLGVLLASPAAEAPSQVMMLSSLVRFPLIFISGIFIPLDKLPFWGKVIAFISPLTYTVDAMKYSLYDLKSYPAFINMLALLFFSFVFFSIALKMHRKNLIKAL